MNKELMLMNKLHLIVTVLLSILFLPAFSQESAIDFRSVDLKYLNDSQRRDYQRWREEHFRLLKSYGLQSEVKSLVIKGNKINSIIYNTGAISNPNVTKNVLDLVWNGLGYGYEFGPLVAARVPKAADPTDSVSIVIDGFGGASGNYEDGDFAPDRITKWGWLPKPGYSYPGQKDIASWGARTSDLRIRPASWPESWYNTILGEYIYPSFLGGNTSVPDEEVYYVVDDSTDAEHDYYPILSNTTRRGLGFNLEVRTMQFANPLAEDIIFLVYTAENDIRSKALPKVYFGMFGDPHIGGPDNFDDDGASFIPARAFEKEELKKFNFLLSPDNGKLSSQLSRNLVFSWDEPESDGQPRGDIPGLPVGYFGYKFLESPNNSTDGIDNDDDGIVDESPYNDKGIFIDGVSILLPTGISDTAKYKALYGPLKPRWSGDEDGDWSKENDDVGVDGILGTFDFGEGNGEPDQLIVNGEWRGSEPNFGFRDVNESDQIGLRSFWSYSYGGDNRPKNDVLMYNSISSEMDSSGFSLLNSVDPTRYGDYIFLYGSGPFTMNPGHKERFSIALLMGSDLPDLLLNSETAQLIMQANYRFAQPPLKPVVTAVPGDGRVTLYWDTRAEGSIDPFTLKKDFEGYKIYRSEDFTFSDIFTITDANGNPYLGKPLYDQKAKRTAQWHRPWTPEEKALYVGGFHPVEYRSRFVKYFLGEPSDSSGLRHEYVDSTVTNGKTYYYAVVSYDHGVYDDSLKLPPTESQAIIQRDPVTQEFKFDVNTVAVIPNALGKGIISMKADIENGMTLQRENGAGTGRMVFKVINEQHLQNSTYTLQYDTVLVNAVKKVGYHVRKDTPFIERFLGNDSLFVSLQHKNIVAASVRVYNGADTNSVEIPADHIVVDSAGGRIRSTGQTALLKTKTYTVAYKYFPIVQSTLMDAGDANPVFDGIRLYVMDDKLEFNAAESYFLPAKPPQLNVAFGKGSVGNERRAPIDVRIQFMVSTADTTASGDYVAPVDSVGNRNNPLTKTVKIPFKVINSTDTSTLIIFVKDELPAAKGGKTGRWDIGEEILIITPIPYRPANNIGFVMEGILFTHKDTAITARATISAGVSYTAVMKKPFSGNDRFVLTTNELVYDPRKADLELDKIIVVPNPYVITSMFELPTNRPDLRGDRVIQFRNLPKECTIRIYTIAGELVRTLRKNDNSNYFNWDVLSSESARIGYGLYIYHVETPTGGTKIGRLGIIK